jgi:hypothetical protein
MPREASFAPGFLYLTILAWGRVSTVMKWWIKGQLLVEGEQVPPAESGLVGYETL